MAFKPLIYNANNQVVTIGPFCNSTDGVTRLTSLTITNNDVKLIKNNATAANNKSAGNGTHIVNGEYYITLNAADTDAYGRLRVDCAMNGSVAVWEDFIVMSPSAFNALAGANNFQADALTVASNAVTAAAFNQAAADKIWATAARTLTAGSNIFSANIIDAASFNQAAADKVWSTATRTLTDSTNIFSANAITAASFNQGAADKVWATAARTLTGATNITTNNNKIVLHTDDKVLLAGTTHTLAVVPTVTTLTGHTPQTADHAAAIADIPTVAEFEARTIASADYTVVSDLGTVQTADHAAAIADLPTNAETAAMFTEIKGATWASGTDTLEAIRDRGDAAWVTATGFSTHSAGDVWGATNATLSLTYAVITSRLYRFLLNKMNITDATGSVALRNEADDGNLATQTITDDDTTTTRTALSWV